TNDLCFFFFGLKDQFSSWIALTFFMFVHQLPLSPHTSRSQYLVEQSCFSLLGGNFLGNTLVNTSLYLTNIPPKWFRGGPFFLASHKFLGVAPIEPRPLYFPFFIWSMKTKFNLGPRTIGVLVNLNFNSLSL